MQIERKSLRSSARTTASVAAVISGANPVAGQYDETHEEKDCIRFRGV
jgi:hypothetical protein